MKNLRRIGAALVLTCVLGLSAFAGQLETPPCAPPEPGQIETPPCASQAVTDNSAAPGQMDCLRALSDVDVVSVAEAAIDLLPIF